VIMFNGQLYFDGGGGPAPPPLRGKHPRWEKTSPGRKKSTSVAALFLSLLVVRVPAASAVSVDQFGGKDETGAGRAAGEKYFDGTDSNWTPGLRASMKTSSALKASSFTPKQYFPLRTKPLEPAAPEKFAEAGTAEESVNLALPSVFQGPAHIASNYSSSVAVQEKEGVFPLVFLAVVLDEVFNDGAVVRAANEALRPLAEELMVFLKILNEVLAELFELVTNYVYDILQLKHIDNAVRSIINGGFLTVVQVVQDLLIHTLKDVKSLFQEINDFDGFRMIRDGLQDIGALQFINRVFKTTTGSEASVAMGSVPEEEELVKTPNGQEKIENLSSKERHLVQGSGGLEELRDSLNEPGKKSMLDALEDEIMDLYMSRNGNTNTGTSALDGIMREVKEILNIDQALFELFIEKTDSLGSIQFLVSVEGAGVAGAVLEAGISIDIKQILHYFTYNGHWNKINTQVASFHVAYAIDLGVQAGVEGGLSIAYHTSPPKDVSGFGYGFSFEGAAGYAAGLSVAWPMPGEHVPNQFVAQIVGAGGSFEFAAFWCHAIIVGFYDSQLGFMLAAPSVTAAKFTGHPSLYYSKYTWDELGVNLFTTNVQTLWSRLGYKECNWEYDCDDDDDDCEICDPPVSEITKWSNLKIDERAAAKALGFDQKTYDSPVAIHGFYYYNSPLEDYFAQHPWATMLDFELGLFKCLGWTEEMWEAAFFEASPVPVIKRETKTVLKGVGDDDNKHKSQVSTVLKSQVSTVLKIQDRRGGHQPPPPPPPPPPSPPSTSRPTSCIPDGRECNGASLSEQCCNGDFTCGAGLFGERCHTRLPATPRPTPRPNPPPKFPNQYPDQWDANWIKLSVEMRVCASAIGYDREKWNGKPKPSSIDPSSKRPPRRTANPVKAPEYMGCYKDDAHGVRALPIAGSSKTIQGCSESCLKKGYGVSGLQYMGQCWCGGEDYDKYGKTTGCDCREGATNHGGNKNCVYRIVPQYMGCYKDDAHGVRALPIPGSSKTNQGCAASCLKKGYGVSGLQYIGQCWCGGEDYDKYGKTTGCDCREGATNHGGNKNCVYRVPTLATRFDPNSNLVSYTDRASCGPRGNDANADLSQCSAGSRVVKRVRVDNWKVVAVVDGCDYFAYTIYECLGETRSWESEDLAVE